MPIVVPAWWDNHISCLMIMPRRFYIDDKAACLRKKTRMPSISWMKGNHQNAFRHKQTKQKSQTLAQVCISFKRFITNPWGRDDPIPGLHKKNLGDQSSWVVDSPELPWLFPMGLAAWRINWSIFSARGQLFYIPPLIFFTNGYLTEWWFGKKCSSCQV